MDQDSLLAVAEDLMYLRDDWGPNIDNAEIRRGSAVLRRLLIENAFGIAWRTVGFLKEPKLIAVDLKNIFGSTPLDQVSSALAGGAHFRGVWVAGIWEGRVLPRGKVTPPLRPEGYPCEREYGLSQFLSSPSAIAKGEVVTRREVIKYIANVKGGVHLSAKQRKAEKKLIERVKKIEKRINIRQSDGLLVELVAIGQAVGRSNDVEVFLKRVPI